MAYILDNHDDDDDDDDLNLINKQIIRYNSNESSS